MRLYNQGSVLVTSLLLLLILNLITLTALQNSTLEERLSGQVRSREQAFTAAETALAVTEQEILTRANSSTLCTQRDEMGLWHGADNWLECLQRSVSPCTQGWCGPQAEETAESDCSVFNPAHQACWSDAPVVERSNLSARAVVRLRACRNDVTQEICLFDVFARAFSDHTENPAATVLLQSQFEVVALLHPTYLSAGEDNNDEEHINGATSCL